MSKGKRKSSGRERSSSRFIRRDDSGRKPTGWFLGLHHIRPSSRNGSNSPSNIYPKERWGTQYSEKHEAWHINFINLTPKEVVDVIRSYTADDGNVSDQFFSMRLTVEHTLVNGKKQKVVRLVKNKQGALKRKRAWMFFFGDLDVQHAIKWIEREFIKKEWLSSSGRSGGLDNGK